MEAEVTPAPLLLGVKMAVGEVIPAGIDSLLVEVDPAGIDHLLVEVDPAGIHPLLVEVAEVEAAPAALLLAVEEVETAPAALLLAVEEVEAAPAALLLPVKVGAACSLLATKVGAACSLLATKAFDSVETNAVLLALQQQGVADEYVALLQELNSGCATNITLFDRPLHIPERTWHIPEYHRTTVCNTFQQDQHRNESQAGAQQQQE
ncbi:UNVERIFIED_CONTAM: hypothetical protein FKN15_025302 [Acipenser sinensis]